MLTKDRASIMAVGSRRIIVESPILPFLLWFEDHRACGNTLSAATRTCEITPLKQADPRGRGSQSWYRDITSFHGLHAEESSYSSARRMLLNPQYASGETSDSLGQKKAQGTRLCLEQKDGPFALSTGNWVYSNTP